MKTVKGKLPAERVEAFEKGAEAFTKKVAANFANYDFVRPRYASGCDMSDRPSSTLASRRMSTAWLRC